MPNVKCSKFKNILFRVTVAADEKINAESREKKWTKVKRVLKYIVYLLCGRKYWERRRHSTSRQAHQQHTHSATELCTRTSKHERARERQRETKREKVMLEMSRSSAKFSLFFRFVFFFLRCAVLHPSVLHVFCKCAEVLHKSSCTILLYYRLDCSIVCGENFTAIQSYTLIRLTEYSCSMLDARCEFERRLNATT